MSTQLTNYNEIKNGIYEMRQRLAANLPDGDVVRFSSMIMNAIDANPKLAECTPSSVFGVAMTIAQLGLDPSPSLGQVYMIPRYDKNVRGQVATFQLGYRGSVQLAMRSPAVSSVEGEYICENDKFELEYGTQRKLRHKPALINRGNVIGYYAIAYLSDGGHSFTMMNLEEVHAVRDQFGSKNRNGQVVGPWISSPTEMGKKTVVKRLTKYLPVQTEYAKALSFEGHTIEVTANDKVQSTDGLEYFDVTDAIPEIAAKKVPKLEAPAPKKETPLDAVKVRVALFASIGQFSKTKQADIMAAIKWRFEIESFSDAKIALISQGQLKDVSGVTKFFNEAKDEGDKADRVNALIEKWKAVIYGVEVEEDAPLTVIEEFNFAVSNALVESDQCVAFVDAVCGLNGVEAIGALEDEALANYTVSIWAAGDEAEKYCINILNEWDVQVKSKEVAA